MNQRFHNTLILLDCLLRAMLAVWTVKNTTVIWSRHFKTLSITFHNHLFKDEIKPGVFYIVTRYTVENSVFTQDIVAEGENLAELDNKLRETNITNHPNISH